MPLENHGNLLKNGAFIAACGPVLEYFADRLALPSLRDLPPIQRDDEMSAEGDFSGLNKPVRIRIAKTCAEEWPHTLAHELFHLESAMWHREHPEVQLPRRYPYKIPFGGGESWGLEDIVVDCSACSLMERLGLLAHPSYRMSSFPPNLIKVLFKQACSELRAHLRNPFSISPKQLDPADLTERLEAVSLLGLMCLRIAAPQLRIPTEIWPEGLPSGEEILVAANALKPVDALVSIREVLVGNKSILPLWEEVWPAFDQDLLEFIEESCLLNDRDLLAAYTEKLECFVGELA